MKGIIFPVLRESESSIQLEELGLPAKMSISEVENVKFYIINALSKYVDEDGTEYAVIHSGGLEYICDLGYDEAEKLIDKM